MRFIKAFLICNLCWIPIILLMVPINVYKIKTPLLVVQLCSFSVVCFIFI